MADDGECSPFCPGYTALLCTVVYYLGWPLKTIQNELAFSMSWFPQ